MGHREATIVAKETVPDSSPIEQNKTAKQKDRKRKEEGIEIEVEEGVYKEVQEWIVKMEGEKKNEDIRTWLVAGKDAKDSRTTIVKVDKEKVCKGERTEDTRMVVRGKDKEKVSQKTREKHGQRDRVREKSVDIKPGQNPFCFSAS